MPWVENNSRAVEDAMREIERRATIPALLYSYELLVAEVVPKAIPFTFNDYEDRVLLEALRKELDKND